MPIRRLVLVLALLLAAPPLFAGDVAGTTADVTGASLPAATVTARHVPTGVESTTLSDADGRFAFSGLPAGPYLVTASFGGLTTETRAIDVPADGRPQVLAFLLKPAGLLEDVTVTATRGERDALLVPLRTDTVGRAELQDLAPTSTGDALLAAPGITPVGGGPYGIRPRLRGLDSTRLLVLVDGERLNNARTATDRAGTEVGLIDPMTIESLEVVGGSGSVLYGTDALAGTINIITTRPRFTDTLRFTYGFDGFYSANEQGGRGTVLFGASTRRLALQVAAGMEDFGDYRAGRAGAGESSRRFFDDGTVRRGDTIDDNFGLRLRAFPDPFNAPFTRTSARIPFSGAEGRSLNATALYALTDTQTLQVKYLRRRMEDVGFPDFEPPMFFQTTSLPYSNLDRVSARYEARSLRPWLASLRVSSYWQDQARQLRTQFPVQFPVPSPAFFPINVFRLDIVADTQQRVKTPGLDVQATLVAGRRHLVTVGTTAYQDRSHDTRRSTTQQSLVGTVTVGPRGPQANVLPSPQPLGPAAVTSPVRVPDARFANVGAYVQDEWELGPALRLVTGLRVDRYAVRVAPTPGYDVNSLLAGARPAIDPAALPDASGDRVTRTAVTGEAGLVWRVTDGVSALARYGRSYRHANLEELLFSGPATVGAIVPNLRVAPETGHNVDLGLKVRGARGSASVSYFANTYDGFISTEIVSVASAGPLSQAINFTDVRIQGVEADAELPLVFRRAVVTFFGTAAWTRGEVLRGSNPLSGASLGGTPADNITPSRLAPGVRVADARNRLWVEYGARIQGRVKRVAPTLLESPFLIPQDLLALDGFTLHRVAAGVNLGQATANRLGLVVAVQNVGDRFYREQFQFAPARGRTVTVGLHVRGL